MGILKGSLTYLRFRVEGPVPSAYVEAFEKAIEIRRFVPLHQDGEDNESFGWVPIQKPYADDEPVLNDYFLYGERVVVGYREDVIVYPKAMIHDQVERRLQEHRIDRKVAQASVMSEMRKRLLPKSKVVDVMWDLSRSELRFFARGKGLTERFTSLFEQTFQVRLRPITFSDMAVCADLSDRSKDVLQTLTPQEIFRLAIRTEVQ